MHCRLHCFSITCRFALYEFGQTYFSEINFFFVWTIWTLRKSFCLVIEISAFIFAWRIWIRCAVFIIFFGILYMPWQYVKQIFTSCDDLLRKKQFCYILARHVSLIILHTPTGTSLPLYSDPTPPPFLPNFPWNVVGSCSSVYFWYGIDCWVLKFIWLRKSGWGSGNLIFPWLNIWVLVS